ncbi:Putative peptidoglycan binding domain-containing protein [Luteibacter sp. UNCMF331Sha3.1]|uniref:VgrG-related protein n=1 Tax=Luteibacter sp. UNCMF331Sha3.1 TaxID=1502760 RepID=UPI0008D0B703|nr:peptidoglycan-binding protein [Luteibacter sp. UNCMF331Sha3.1]SEM79878.1 Putative peptidoglycan binding domain-containing protein [Luteibacter sp. UNCMF331Sha3.1]
MEAGRGWTIGQTSRRYEAGGRGAGTISTGKGDKGGVSYGQYQLSSKAKTVDEYLKWSKYRDEFAGLEVNSPAFKQKWKELASVDSGFGVDQHEFIKAHHYAPQMRALAGQSIDLTTRGPAVQDAIWSTSVQYRGLTQSVFKNGLTEKFGPNFKLSDLSDQQIVEAVQDYKAAHVESNFRGSPENWEGIRNRIRDERRDLVEFARTGVHPSLTEDSPEIARSSNTLKLGMRGDRVSKLQSSLRDLGYLGSDGNQLVSDGHFGPNTRDAVQAFQRSSGLTADGQVGAKTMSALEDKIEAAKSLDVDGMAHETPSQNHEPSRAPIDLTDPRHPDHTLSSSIRAGVVELHEREQILLSSDQVDRVTAALTAEVKGAGLTHVDEIRFGRLPTGELHPSIHAYQVLDGRLDHPYTMRASVYGPDAVNVPVETSQEKLQQVNQQIDNQQQMDLQVQQGMQQQQSSPEPSIGGS